MGYSEGATAVRGRRARCFLLLFIIALLLAAVSDFFFAPPIRDWSAYVGGLIGGALPAFAFACIAAYFARGRQSLIVGVVVLVIVEASIMWTRFEDARERQHSRLESHL